MAKPRILMMSDFPLLHTGQAVVLREIALGLNKTQKFDMAIAGWGYNGMPHNFPIQIFPSSGRDFGRNGFPEANIPGIEQLVDAYKPDILWTVGDMFMVNYIREIRNRRAFKWIAYTPIDGSPVPVDWEPWMRNPDQIVCEADWGISEINAMWPDIKLKRIYHGCNPNSFYPLPQEVKKSIRRGIQRLTIKNRTQLAIEKGIPEDAFVVGVVARNQPRKNFDRILKTFKVFSEGKNNVYLWCHAMPIDQGYDLIKLSWDLGIADKVFFTPNYSIGNGLSEQDLNAVMNIFDVHFLPTQGEGFGIPILETMAAGIPQVVSGFSSHVEFAKEGGLMIPCTPYDDFILGAPHPVERAVPKVTESARLINELYEKKDLRESLAKSARAKAETMTWECTIPDWVNVIEEVLSRNSNTASEPLKVIKL
jgi:glycosyltransferase involved in cell wall biosynthesis